MNFECAQVAGNDGVQKWITMGEWQWAALGHEILGTPAEDGPTLVGEWTSVAGYTSRSHWRSTQMEG